MTGGSRCATAILAVVVKRVTCGRFVGWALSPCGFYVIPAKAGIQNSWAEVFIEYHNIVGCIFQSFNVSQCQISESAD